MSSDKKVIAVVGATGAQGGGLIRAILADPRSEFAARAITRDVASAKARELERLGAEVVAGDVDDPASIERAFAGAYGAFAVTFFWNHFTPERETAQARGMAQAAQRAGLKHVIWSTLEDSRRFVPLSDNRMPTLGGRYKVPHFDAKGEADHFFIDLGVPTTFLLTSFYWDNFIHFGMGPKKGEDGSYRLTLPLRDQKLPGIAAEDIGRCAYGIFKEGPGLVGKTIGVAGEHSSGAELARGLARALGRDIRYQEVGFEDYRRFGFPGADDLGNMFQFNVEFQKEFRAAREVEAARRLNPALQSFDEWAAANASLIPLED